MNVLQSCTIRNQYLNNLLMHIFQYVLNRRFGLHHPIRRWNPPDRSAYPHRQEKLSHEWGKSVKICAFLYRRLNVRKLIERAFQGNNANSSSLKKCIFSLIAWKTLTKAFYQKCHFFGFSDFTQFSECTFCHWNWIKGSHKLCQLPCFLFSWVFYAKSLNWQTKFFFVDMLLVLRYVSIWIQK